MSYNPENSMAGANDKRSDLDIFEGLGKERGAGSNLSAACTATFACSWCASAVTADVRAWQEDVDGDRCTRRHRRFAARCWKADTTTELATAACEPSRRQLATAQDEPASASTRRDQTRTIRSPAAIIIGRRSRHGLG